jgi:adenylate cyclase
MRICGPIGSMAMAWISSLLQSEITGRIAVALNIELVTAEAGRPTEHPDALDCILRGRTAFSKPPTPASLAEAIDWIERALALDPRSTEVQSLLGWFYAYRVLNQMSDSCVFDIARAEEVVARALASSPSSPFANLAKGQVLRAQGRCEEAISEYETVIASDPNAIWAIADLGFCKLQTGSLEESITLMERAIRLSPRDPAVGIWYSIIGRAHLLQSCIDQAIVWLEKAQRANPQQARTHAYLASAYGLKNEIERAAGELGEARRLSTDNRFSSIVRLKATEPFGVPKIQHLREATYFAGLRKAGTPEE